MTDERQPLFHVRFINAQGGGYAKDVPVFDEGTTVGELIASQMEPGTDLNRFSLLVDGRTPARYDELKEGSLVEVTEILTETVTSSTVIAATQKGSKGA